MGVVYAPMSNIIFYGTMGKGAFCSESGAEPRQLKQHKTGISEITETQFNIYSASNWQKKNDRFTASTALMICLIADGKLEHMKNIETSMEWQTGAAHVIAEEVGLKLKLCDTKNILTYNKETFENSCITVV